jgi:hypothetical protein
MTAFSFAARQGEVILSRVTAQKNRCLRGTQELCDLTAVALHCFLGVSSRPAFVISIRGAKAEASA